MDSILTTEPIKQLIVSLRGENVILDKDIATLYGVSTGALNQAVKRNLVRFPSDFMFQLTEEEWATLKSQIVIAKKGRGGSRTLPFAFTEYGVLMLASVLLSDIAAQASINIARIFAEMRRYLVHTTKLSSDISELRTRIKLLEYQDEENLEAVNDLSEDMPQELNNLYNAIAALSAQIQSPSQSPRRKIGFILPGQD